MKNKRIIIITIMSIAVILTVTLGLILKPKYELNKAVEYIKDGQYNEAYKYISRKGNKENTDIVKELITLEFFENVAKGADRGTEIVNKGAEIFKNVNRNEIDYSLDDQLNIYVKKLEDYINVKEKISKEMIIEELYDSYDLYFEVLEFVNENFMDVLENINNQNFISEASKMSLKMTTLGVQIQSIEDNYNFSSRTKEIYEAIKWLLLT